MSFSENLFPEEKSRQEEMHGTDTAKLHKPADGTTVWNAPQDITDDLEKNKDKKKHDIPTLSVEEMQKFVDTWKTELEKFAKINPDSLAAKDQWPEAMKQAWLEVKEKWPA
jgi:hypothetical protein